MFEEGTDYREHEEARDWSSPQPLASSLKLDLPRQREGNYQCIDRQGFDEGDTDNHRRLNPVSCVRIPANRFHGCGHGSPLTQSSTERRNTDPETSGKGD